jgi:hypothetical protein
MTGAASMSSNDILMASTICSELARLIRTSETKAIDKYSPRLAACRIPDFKSEITSSDGGCSSPVHPCTCRTSLLLTKTTPNGKNSPFFSRKYRAVFTASFRIVFISSFDILLRSRRTASYPTAPAQIPACGFSAPGSSEYSLPQSVQSEPAASQAKRRSTMRGFGS